MIGYGKRRSSLGQSRRLSSERNLSSASKGRLSVGGNSTFFSPGALPGRDSNLTKSIGDPAVKSFKTSFGSPDAIHFDEKILLHAFSSLEQYVSEQTKIDSRESPVSNVDASGHPGSNENRENSFIQFDKDDLESLTENLFDIMLDEKENDGCSKLAATSESRGRAASTPRKSLAVLTPRNKDSIETPPRHLLKGLKRLGSFSQSYKAEKEQSSQTEPNSYSDKNISSQANDDVKQVHTGSFSQSCKAEKEQSSQTEPNSYSDKNISSQANDDVKQVHTTQPSSNISCDDPKRKQQATDDVDTEVPGRKHAEIEEVRAYSVWKSRGLMGRQKTPPRVKIPMSLTTDDGRVSGLSCTSHQSNELDPPPHTIVVVTTPDQDDLDESITASEAEDTDQRFSDMLHQWQDKSDHNPNGHFLSPPVSKAHRGSAGSNLKVDVDGRRESLEIYREGSDSFNRHDTSCTCTTSIFSGNGALVDFYLPKLGMACTCGKQSTTIPPGTDPMLLENILRPWQVEFLSSFGIRTGEELIKVYHRRGDLLAKALKLWRRERGMPNARTESCNMALQIWSRTSKVYVRSVRTQLGMGKDILDQPNVLEALSSMMGSNKAMKKTRKKRRSSPREAIEPESQAEI